MAIISKPINEVQPPNSLSSEAEGAVAVPNNLSAETEGAVGVPNALTSETEGQVGLPNSLTSKTEGVVSAPNALSSQSEAQVGLPNSLSAQSEGVVAVPNVLASETEGAVGLPNSLSSESIVDPLVPNSLTSQSAAAVSRALIPLVDMHFFSQNYSQNGNPITFADLFTFTRASTGTFIGRDIVNNKAVFTLKTAAIDEARFEFDAATGESLGVLIEDASTNLAIRSEEFDNGIWGKTRSSISQNVITSPDGTINADKLVEDNTASDTHFVSDDITVAAGSVSVAIFAKAAERTQIRMQNAAELITATFDLLTGTLDNENGTDSTSIISVGDGWFLCSMTLTSSGGAQEHRFMPAIAGSPIYSGDGSSGVYVFGAQVEDYPSTTSYIKTLAAPVARVADLLDILNITTLTPFEFSITSESSFMTADASTKFTFSYNDGTDPNRVSADFNGDPRSIRLRVINDGDSQVFINTDSDKLPNVFYKKAITFGGSLVSGYFNGALIADDSTFIMPSGLTDLSIGNKASGTVDSLSGHIKKLTFYNDALTAQEVALL